MKSTRQRTIALSLLLALATLAPHGIPVPLGLPPQAPEEFSRVENAYRRMLRALSGYPQYCNTLPSPVTPPLRSQPEIKRFTLSQSKDALELILREMEVKFNDRKCDQTKTLFVFDVDETVLTRLPNNHAISIRNSANVLSRIQQLGVPTLALTIRDVVHDRYRHWLSTHFKETEATKYLYGQANFLREDIKMLAST